MLSTIVLTLLTTALVRSAPLSQVMPEQTSYIVMLVDDISSPDGRSPFGSFDSLITKHKRILHKNNEDSYGARSSMDENSFEVLESLRGYVASIPLELIDEIRRQPETIYLEPDFGVTLNLPNSTSRRIVSVPKTTQKTVYSWGIDRIDGKLDGQFMYPSTSGAGVTIYVLDTGISRSHLDFTPTSRLLPGKSFVQSESDETDYNGHGTHVAGTAAGTYSGVAKKAQIMAIKILDEKGEGSLAGIIRGMEYVLSDHNIKKRKSVINMSLGAGKSATLNAAVAKLSKAGIIVVVAAGNENQDACLTSPASAATAISVGATTRRDYKASFSNWGKCISVHAPGADIVSAHFENDGQLSVMSGTSMASPHVAGIAAILLGSGVNPLKIKDTIANQATPVVKSVRAGTNNLLVLV